MTDIIIQAAEFAEKAHGSQKRSDGSPYFYHPKRVAELVGKYKNSSHADELIAAAYLHDVLEDTKATYYDLVNSFGYLTASLVMELTSNPDMKQGVGDKKKYLSYKLKHMTNWALVIKLCDRLDNITDMEGCSIEWRERYTVETLFIIDYLEKNRELTPTHKRIITDIKTVFGQ